MQDLSEFQSGEDYDALYGRLYEPEIWYLTQLAIKQNGAVLDVCCGTGIVTIPVAVKTGLEVHGVDLAEDMLAHAKKKSENVSNIHFHMANALEFDLTQRFDLALMTGNAFQAFLSEAAIMRLLKNIHRHLNDAGVFVFDTRLLEHFKVTMDEDFVFKKAYVNSAGRQVKYYNKKSRYDESQQILYSDMKREYDNGDVIFSAIELKFVPYERLIEIFQQSGFELTEKYSEWDLSPFNPQADKAVFKLVKR